MFYRLGKSQKNLMVGGLHQPPPPQDVRGLIEFEMRGRYQNRN